MSASTVRVGLLAALVPMLWGALALASVAANAWCEVEGIAPAKAVFARRNGTQKPPAAQDGKSCQHPPALPSLALGLV